MIIGVPDGRLGNQLFQVSHLLAQRRPGERVYVLGGELENLLDLTPARVVAFRLEGILERFLAKAKLLVPRKSRRLGVVALLSDDAKRSECQIRGARALVFHGFFQWDEGREIVRSVYSLIRPSIHLEASTRMSSGDRSGSKRAFVHVRLGDYRNWPDPVNPAAVPLYWYARQMQRLRGEMGPVEFLVFSDEELEEDCFPGLDWRQVHASPETTLVMMSKCDAGVLSASSFSWWGAALAKARDYHSGPFLAPRCWIGWPTNEWVPPQIKSDFLEYAAID